MQRYSDIDTVIQNKIQTRHSGKRLFPISVFSLSPSHLFLSFRPILSLFFTLSRFTFLSFSSNHSLPVPHSLPFHISFYFFEPFSLFSSLFPSTFVLSSTDSLYSSLISLPHFFLFLHPTLSTLFTLFHSTFLSFSSTHSPSAFHSLPFQCFFLSIRLNHSSFFALFSNTFHSFPSTHSLSVLYPFLLPISFYSIPLLFSVFHFYLSFSSAHTLSVTLLLAHFLSFLLLYLQFSLQSIILLFFDFSIVFPDLQPNVAFFHLFFSPFLPTFHCLYTFSLCNTTSFLSPRPVSLPISRKKIMLLHYFTISTYKLCYFSCASRCFRAPIIAPWSSILARIVQHKAITALDQSATGELRSSNQRPTPDNPPMTLHFGAAAGSQ